MSVDASPVESANLFFVFFTLALDRKMLVPSDRSSARAKSSGLSAGDAARSAHDPPMEMRARCRWQSSRRRRRAPEIVMLPGWNDRETQ